MSITKVRLFISHSAEDARLATLLVELIDAVLAVPAKAIRCTSVPGYKLEPGADGPDELRNNLRSARVVLGLVTKNSLESSFVLMELGAGWGLGMHVIPLVAGVRFGEIPAPIGPGVHAVDITDDAGMADVLTSVSERCEMPTRGEDARRYAAIKAFVEAATSTENSAPVSATQAEPSATETASALEFLGQYLENLVLFKTARDELRELTRANHRGNAAPDDVAKGRRYCERP